MKKLVRELHCTGCLLKSSLDHSAWAFSIFLLSIQDEKASPHRPAIAKANEYPAGLSRPVSGVSSFRALPAMRWDDLAFNLAKSANPRHFASQRRRDGKMPGRSKQKTSKCALRSAPRATK